MCARNRVEHCGPAIGKGQIGPELRPLRDWPIYLLELNYIRLFAQITLYLTYGEASLRMIQHQEDASLVVG